MPSPLAALEELRIHSECCTVVGAADDDLARASSLRSHFPLIACHTLADDQPKIADNHSIVPEVAKSPPRVGDVEILLLLQFLLE